MQDIPDQKFYDRHADCSNIFSDQVQMTKLSMTCQLQSKQFDKAGRSIGSTLGGGCQIGVEIARTFLIGTISHRLDSRPGNIQHVRNLDRKSTRLNSSHDQISYAVFCLKKKKALHVLADLRQ